MDSQKPSAMFNPWATRVRPLTNKNHLAFAKANTKILLWPAAHEETTSTVVLAT